MNDIRDDYLKFKVDDDTVGGGGGIFSTIIKILAIILLLLLLVVLGGLAYKFLLKDDTIKQAVRTNIQPVQQTQPSKQEQVVAAVTNQVNQGGVKKEEIALIVKSVLEQMNKEKSVQKTQVQPVQNSNTSEQQTTTDNKQEDSGDATLLNDLSAAKVDNVEEDDIDLSALDSVNSNKQIKNNSKKADTFNKVIIDKNEVATKDDLTKLYAKLNKIMKKDKTKVKAKSSKYVSNLKKETQVRKNAMRIITVRRGDTLSLIAARAYGDAMMYPKIYAANPDLVKNPNLIYIGQKLRVPK